MSVLCLLDRTDCFEDKKVNLNRQCWLLAAVQSVSIWNAKPIKTE